MTYEEREAMEEAMSEEEKNKRNMWKEEMRRMGQALNEWMDLFYPYEGYTG